MRTNRRAFLITATASSAMLFFRGPLAWAAPTDADARAAGAFIKALATDATNRLNLDRDWAALAQERFSDGIASRLRFASLRADLPNVETLKPVQLAQELAGRLNPAYEGPRSITREQVAAEIALVTQAPAATGVPSQTGEFAFERAPAGVRTSLMPDTPASDLRRGRVVIECLTAVEDMVDRNLINPDAEPGAPA